jgi:hypothetical protein
MPDIRTLLRFQEHAVGCHNKKIDVFSPFPSPRQLSVSGDSHAAPSSSAPNDSPLAAPTLIH